MAACHLPRGRWGSVESQPWFFFGLPVWVVDMIGDVDHHNVFVAQQPHTQQSEKNHLMEPVQQWVGWHRVMLRGLTRQDVTELDLWADRLGICLEYLHGSSEGHAIEEKVVSG